MNIEYQKFINSIYNNKSQVMNSPATSGVDFFACKTPAVYSVPRTFDSLVGSLPEWLPLLATVHHKVACSSGKIISISLAMDFNRSKGMLNKIENKLVMLNIHFWIYKITTYLKAGIVSCSSLSIIVLHNQSRHFGSS